MKRYCFALDERLVSEFFTPVRSKRDVVLLLMKSIKVMLIDSPIDQNRVRGKLTLIVSKMSRLFYFSENKFFSISFPFSVIENKGEIEFSSKTVKLIDSKITSDVIGVVSKIGFQDTECALEFIDPIIEIADFEHLFWPFLLHLFMYEDGYIRYDYDEKNQRGDHHPLSHYDIFYSSLSTFKVGLRNRLEADSMLDFLDSNSICHYLECAT
jgi:hypothetical protein